MNRDKALYDLENAARDLASIVGTGSGLSLSDLTTISNTCRAVQHVLMDMLGRIRGTILSGG